jgi:predicted small metal-binding protein
VVDGDRLHERSREPMPKVLECAKVDPSSGCQHVVRGETEDEVLRNAGEHAREHGIREVTPELAERVRANIRDA